MLVREELSPQKWHEENVLLPPLTEFIEEEAGSLDYWKKCPVHRIIWNSMGTSYTTKKILCCVELKGNITYKVSMCKRRLLLMRFTPLVIFIPSLCYRADGKKIMFRLNLSRKFDQWKPFVLKMTFVYIRNHFHWLEFNFAQSQKYILRASAFYKRSEVINLDYIYK